jgi:predicted DNA-binding protein YlxM (UPF0122 family)
MRSFRGVPYVHPPERIEKIVSLHFTHGVSYGKIAKLFNISRQAVAGIISRYRRNTGNYPVKPK